MYLIIGLILLIFIIIKFRLLINLNRFLSEVLDPNEVNGVSIAITVHKAKERLFL